LRCILDVETLKGFSLELLDAATRIRADIKTFEKVAIGDAQA
jgi:hypothetical protein